MKRKRGRPKNLDPNRKKISIDQAVELTKEYWAKFNLPGYAKGTIYNKISSGELSKEDHGRVVLLYEDEVRQKLCG